jgi:hypothetical protein
MEIRAKATALQKHSVAYGAEAALVRGASRRLRAMAYVRGGGNVEAYVQTGSVDAAHLVSGWRQPHVAQSGVAGPIYSVPLEVILTRPYWWTADQFGWRALANHSADLLADRERWLERCAGFCVRTLPVRDDLAYVQVDLDEGRCSCYEHASDLEHHNVSIVRPSDVDALLWLRSASRVADEARQALVNIYAVQRTPPAASDQLRYVGGAPDGALLWEPLVDDVLFYNGAAYTLAPQPALRVAPTYGRLECAEKCAQRCARDLGHACEVAAFDRSAGMYDEARCACFRENLLDHAFDAFWIRRDETTLSYLRLEWCPGVSSWLERSVVWSKRGNNFCHGKTTLYILTLLPNTEGTLSSITRSSLNFMASSLLSLGCKSGRAATCNFDAVSRSSSVNVQVG